MKRFLSNTDIDNENAKPPVQKVCFTANSIHYLATMHLPVNLDEWEWHEEMIDGARTFVITDKKSTEENKPVSFRN
ncbi:hypothetical protein U0035_22145 [Niabella yanshanensis]|uniref:Uncharacterized protein n=1 Tax=Niabella yanshanensis TaxID=577386 RepID=A0ABZ0W620_9BACT|nr:hypothetical protein [Niabella yanshanensis]WQD38379.1 hypothetical protein U0035_22145 [Niabella yanshanensis]